MLQSLCWAQGESALTVAEGESAVCDAGGLGENVPDLTEFLIFPSRYDLDSKSENLSKHVSE